jgi:GSCFA family
MQLQTTINILPNHCKIDYDSTILSMGSCFAENIGNKLTYYKYKNKVNPFGIIFNVISIEKLLQRIVYQKKFTEKDIFYHNEAWHCFEVHSEMSSYSKDALLEKLNITLEETFEYIKNTSHCILTYGTSWVYKHKETFEIVANCYKLPQQNFEKKLITTEETLVSLTNIVSLIHFVNPKVQFIFTISPVRHIKDGFVENNVSKAHLVSAVYVFVNQVSTKNYTSYFPSYEIVLDELRDYRFYTEDMLHPNQLAINYIWEKFIGSYTSIETQKLSQEIENIQKDLQHKVFHTESESYLKFKNKLQQKIVNLKEKLPHITFDN